MQRLVGLWLLTNSRSFAPSLGGSYLYLRGSDFQIADVAGSGFKTAVPGMDAVEGHRGSRSQHRRRGAIQDKEQKEEQIMNVVSHDPLVSTKELARHLFVSRSTIWRMVRTKAIPVVRVGRQYRYCVREVSRALLGTACGIKHVPTDPANDPLADQ
jgi:excisionase family DNA binding protein